MQHRRGSRCRGLGAMRIGYKSLISFMMFHAGCGVIAAWDAVAVLDGSRSMPCVRIPFTARRVVFPVFSRGRSVLMALCA